MVSAIPVLFVAGVGALLLIIVALLRYRRLRSESLKLQLAHLRERQEHLRRTLSGECADGDCPHGKCGNHEVEYDVIEIGFRFASGCGDPDYTPSAPQCCDEQMLACKRMELRKCKECGVARALAMTDVDSRVGTLFNNWYAICSCCKTVLRYVPCRSAWEPATKCGIPIELKIVDW